MHLPGPMAVELADSFWRSLHYFSIYRLVVAALFFGFFLLTGGSANIGSQSGQLFLWVAAAYLFASVLFLFALRRPRRFNMQLSAQVLVDVIALVLLMYASGGSRSGIAVMLVVVVAGAGLVGQGRLALFYAALASVGVLGEQVFRTLQTNADSESLVRAGLLSSGFFATAMIAHLLARRAMTNEALARQRGAELQAQIQINQQVIRDMDDGILVVDGDGRVLLHNPRAEGLLLVPVADKAAIDDLSPVLAGHLQRHDSSADSAEVLQIPGSGKSVLARILPQDQGGNTLIYLQDLGRAQAHAQQMKLAALGRLTANLAHEIRNPLGAISHAAELLADEQRAEGRNRLVRIIGDNVGRLNRLVGEVLELGRRDRAVPEAIPLEGFLRQFLDEYALHDNRVRERAALSVAGEATVQFDRAHLHRVLENLLTNALRYAGATPGSIRLEARPAVAPWVELHIIDNGPGIPESEWGQVFEPFFTTRGGGTGLGLYIARELCEANGARLDLIEAAAGAHFCIFAKEGSCPANPNAATVTS